MRPQPVSFVQSRVHLSVLRSKCALNVADSHSKPGMIPCNPNTRAPEFNPLKNGVTTGIASVAIIVPFKKNLIQPSVYPA